MQEEGKITKFLRSNYFTGVCMVLVAVSAFSLGRVSKIKETREPVRIVQEKVEIKGEVKGVSVEVLKTAETIEVVVGSRNGTKYHYPWCAGASQIADKNKITFNSIEEARAKGYIPALNCKGLK